MHETSTTRERELDEAAVKHMAERFLRWRLPEEFHPDAGISFEPTYNNGTDTPAKHEPVGTNLFSYTQAVEMVCFMLDGLPTPSSDAPREPPSFEQKTAINVEFQRLYDEGMREGKHGHYETMFVAMHKAYASYLASPSAPASDAQRVKE